MHGAIGGASGLLQQALSAGLDQGGDLGEREAGQPERSWPTLTHRYSLAALLRCASMNRFSSAGVSPRSSAWEAEAEDHSRREPRGAPGRGRPPAPGAGPVGVAFGGVVARLIGVFLARRWAAAVASMTLHQHCRW